VQYELIKNNRQTDKLTDGQTDRQKQTNRQTDRIKIDTPCFA